MHHFCYLVFMFMVIGEHRETREEGYETLSESIQDLGGWLWHVSVLGRECRPHEMATHTRAGLGNVSPQYHDIDGHHRIKFLLQENLYVCCLFLLVAYIFLGNASPRPKPFWKGRTTNCFRRVFPCLCCHRQLKSMEKR